MDFMRRDVSNCCEDVGLAIVDDTFCTVRIPKDGVCLFKSVCFSLLAKLGSEYAFINMHDDRLSTMAVNLRHKVCEEISDGDLKLKEEYHSFIYEDEEGLFGATVDNYVTNLFAGEVFGGHLELITCSKLLKVCIIVMQQDVDRFVCTPIGTEFFRSIGSCIFIILRKLHYNSLVFRKSP
jgi:hypothetical protein